MNSRERVRAALQRQPVDRVPVYMWFHPDTAAHLSHLLEIPAALISDAMGNDIHQTWVNNNYAMEGITHQKDGERHQDDWGIVWERGYGFNQIIYHPLAAATRAEMQAYTFPYEQIPNYMELFRPLAENSHAQGYYLGCDVSPCIFEMYWRLRGMEPAMMDMVDDPNFAQEMFKRCADYAVALAKESCDRFPLDWLWTGDDVASQQGMMVSPRQWRRMIKPELQRIFDIGLAHGLPVAYHCCGSLRPIIPDLIEMGLTVLNPIQSNCPGMDPLELKHEFGAKLSFMGGVDTVGLLPHGTVSEVQRETTHLLEGMTADGGGYILAASHTIPPETPDENIFAMYEVAGIPRESIFDRAAAIRQQLAADPPDSNQANE